MNNGWQELQYVEALKECARLRKENAELLAALKQVVSDYDDLINDQFGGNFSNGKISALIARVEGYA